MQWPPPTEQWHVYTDAAKVAIVIATYNFSIPTQGMLQIDLNGNMISQVFKRSTPSNAPHTFAAAADYTTTSTIRQHTSAYVSIRQHTSAYVSIRQQSYLLIAF